MTEPTLPPVYYIKFTSQVRPPPITPKTTTQKCEQWTEIATTAGRGRFNTHTQPNTEHARTTSGHDTEDDETNDEDSSSDDSDPDSPDLPHKTLQDRRTQDHIIDIARKTSPFFTITASEMGTVTALDPITKSAMAGFLGKSGNKSKSRFTPRGT